MGCGGSASDAENVSPKQLSEKYVESQETTKETTSSFVTEKSRNHDFKDAMNLASKAASFVPIFGSLLAGCLQGVGVVAELYRDGKDRMEWLDEASTILTGMYDDLHQAKTLESLNKPENDVVLDNIRVVLLELSKAFKSISARGIEGLLTAQGDKEKIQSLINKLRTLRGDAAFKLSLGLATDVQDNKASIAFLTNTLSLDFQLHKMIRRSSPLNVETELHMPAYGHDTRKFEPDKTPLFLVLEEVLAFTQAPAGSLNSLLILGESGSGKSTFLQHLRHVMSNKSMADPSAPVPIYIDLPKLASHKEGVRSVLSKGGISADNINELMDVPDKTFVFLFDSYDEVPGVDVRLFADNELTEWKSAVKIITTCRTQYKQDISDDLFIDPAMMMQGPKLRTIYMSALNDANRKEYVAKWAALHPDGWTAEEYLANMAKLKGVDDFTSTFLKLSVVLKVLPALIQDQDAKERENNFLELVPAVGPGDGVDAIDVYNKYVVAYFKRQLNKEECRSKSVKQADLQQFCEDFSRMLHMNDPPLTSISFDANSARDVRLKGKWNAMLGDDPKKKAVRAGALLKVQAGTHSFEFEHKSFQDYFLSCAITRDVRENFYEVDARFNPDTLTFPSLDYRSLSPFSGVVDADASLFLEFEPSAEQVTALTGSPLNSKLQSEILVFLAEHAANSIDWMIDALFLVVYASRSTDKLNWAASNAMTVLNLLHLKRYFTFSRMDLSNVKIPYAHLQCAMFAQTNFSGANLSHVHFQNVCLDGAKLNNGCNLSNVNFYMQPALLGHTDGVDCVAFSPDGKYIVSGSGKSVHIWDATTSEELHKSIGHTGPVAFSPDGKNIVSGSSAWGDKSMRIWNATTGEELHKLIGHTSDASCVAFSPDGKNIASGGSLEESVRIWNATTGEELRKLDGHTDYVKSVAFSPDGKNIVSGSLDKSVRIWDATTGEELRKLDGHTDHVNSVAFSPDGKNIVSGSWDKSVRIWNATTGEELRKLDGHADGVDCVAFSHDGKNIVSGSFDKSVRIWDATTGEELHKLDGHTNFVNSVTFSPDGKNIVSGSRDKSVRVWNATTVETLHKLDGHTARVQRVTFSPDGTKVASGSLDDSVRIWDATTGEELRRLHKLDCERWGVNVVALSEKQLVGCNDYQDYIQVWDATTGEELHKLVHKLDGRTLMVKSVAFSPDGKYIVSGTKQGSVHVWDASTGEELHKLTGQSGFVECVAFSPDGKYIVSGADTSVVWNAATGEELHKLDGSVNCVAFSPDGKKVASGSLDESVRIWDATTGEELHKLDGHTSGVNSVTFSPDGKNIISGCFDKSVRIWNATTGEFLSDGSKCLATPVSPNGKRTVDCSSNAVLVKDIETECTLWFSSSPGLSVTGVIIGADAAVKSDDTPPEANVISAANFKLLQQLQPA